MSLKRKQWEMAMGGNITMLIWLGKQNLGQTDKVEQRTNLTADVTTQSSFRQDTIDQFKELVRLKYNGSSKA